MRARVWFLKSLFVIPLLYSCQLPLKKKNKKKKMALPLLRIPGNCCIPFTKTQTFHSKSLRKKTTVAVTGVQTPVGVAGGSDFQFPSGDVPSHKITVHDRQRGVVHEFQVPEDQYILHTAESQNITLPFACRHGCCTSCAVRIKNGQIRQPQALGISAELREKGYALLCVSFPTSDVEVETQDEDEVYWLQFGRYFARGPVERDDYALELAMGDE